jgi:DNA-binding transcriptional regulator YdaS (Cro superfamily)
MTSSVYDTGIYKAVQKAGGPPHLASRIGVSRQAVYEWLQRGYVPAKRAIQIGEAFGIPREELIDPRLRSAMADSSNPDARAGLVAYAPRKAPVVDESEDAPLW